MAAPTVRSVGAYSGGQTASFTASAPAGVASGDLLICTVEGGNAAETCSMTNWTQLTSRQEGTSTATTWTWIFARIADGSANDAAAVTLGGTVNHASAQVIAIQTGTHGVTTVGVGTEIVVGTIAGTAAGTAAAGRTVAGITVTADSLILICVNTGFNGTSSAQLANVTNSNLASLTERMDDTSTIGTGGGVGMWTGTCAGTTVGTTTYDAATTENDNKVHIGIPPASTVANLVIANMAVAAAMGNVALTQVHELVIQNMAAATSMSNVALVVDLVIQAMAVAPTLQNVVLTQTHVLAIQGMAVTAALENATLTQVHNLTIQDMAVGTTEGNVVLTQAHNLAVQNMAVAAALENVVLGTSSAVDLVIQGMAVAAALENATLTGVHELAIQNMAAATVETNAVLTQVHELVIGNMAVAVSIENVTLSVPGEEPTQQNVVRLRRRRWIGT